MQHSLELGYLGVEVEAPEALGGFLADVVGLVPGAPTTEGDPTWRDDGKAHRIIVGNGPANDASYVGFEATSADAFAAVADRLTSAGYPLVEGTDEERLAPAGRGPGAHRCTPVSHSVPSTPTSYQRPSTFGSRTKSAMSASPMLWSLGHQVPNCSVNTLKARSWEVATVMVLPTGV